MVDGELVALDERGRPDVGRLQHRMHVTAPTAVLIAEVPVQYVVFDLPRHDGRSTTGLPYTERRALLDSLDLDAAPGWRVAPNFVDVAGSMVMAAAEQQGLEGVVANGWTRPTSRGAGPGAGSRPRSAIRHTHEVIIAGWSAGAGNRHDSIGALLLAAHDEGGQLVYVGDVGTGFTDTARHRPLERLRDLERPGSPFGGEFARARGWPGRGAGRGEVRWVEPVLAGRSSTGLSPTTARSDTSPGAACAPTATPTRYTYHRRIDPDRALSSSTTEPSRRAGSLPVVARCPRTQPPGPATNGMDLPEIAALTRRLRELSTPGRAVDPGERAAFLGCVRRGVGVGDAGDQGVLVGHRSRTCRGR